MLHPLSVAPRWPTRPCAAVPDCVAGSAPGNAGAHAQYTGLNQAIGLALIRLRLALPCLIVLSLPVATQAQAQSRASRYKVIDGHALIEQDILIGRPGADGRFEQQVLTRGLGLARVVDRWPDGIMPYQLDDAIDGPLRERVLEAIAHWNANTRLSIIERTPDNASRFKDFVRFEPGNRCASYVGRNGDPAGQPIWLSSTCTTGSIIHELGHAVGLYHEHTRPDRDSYIQIEWGNIVSGSEFNFDMVSAGVTQHGDYDYGSIMHYGDHFFSANGKPTIRLRSAGQGIDIGQRLALSSGDQQSVDRMYATDLALSSNATESRAGVEVAVNVSNLGEMGAHALELRFDYGDQAEWKSITTGSGWDCQSYGGELVCKRDTLVETDQSRFVLLVDPGDDTAELAAELKSRTLDLDPNNNKIGQVDLSVKQEPAKEPLLGAGTEESGAPADDNGATDHPEPAAAAPTTQQASTGGGGHLSWLLLALAGLALRRRKATTLRG